VNVTIPCGQGVLLDVPAVKLTVLQILGSLKVKDDPSLPRVSIQASFIIVEGRFIIGSAAQHFTQKAVITLLPNPNNRANYLYTSRAPAEPAYPRNLGHKAFAIVGGQVDFHGMPGGGALTWTKLVATAGGGTTSLKVNGDVSSWPIGAPVVVAPTDFRYNEEDVRTIVGRSCSLTTTPKSCTLTLDKALTYNHYGNPWVYPTGSGVH